MVIGAPMFEIQQKFSSERLESCQYFLGSWFALLYFAASALYATSISQALPGFVSINLAAFVFCFGPGFALYSLISLSRGSHFSYMTLFVLSCSLGFTYNFLANVLIYVFHPSLQVATSVYLFSVAIIYLFLLVFWKHKGVQLFASSGLVGWRPMALLAVALLVFMFVLFLKMPAGFYVEELVILRKLFENHEITATNIAFHMDERTTYYFVPFYLFIAMCAQFSGLDVIQAVSGLWGFTASVSLLCMVATSLLIYRHWAVAASIVAMATFHALFLNQPTSNHLTVFAPFPDRYALASGVLIPLALFHFLIHMGEKKINIPAFVGLVYLITEITFIHARETLFFVGIVLVCMSIMLFDLKRNRQDLIRIFWLLCIVGGILLAYRHINLASQPDLDGYIARLRGDMVNQLRVAWEQYGIGSMFGFPQFQSALTESSPYFNQFRLWSIFEGMGFVPIVICLLPLYALSVERPAMLLAPAVIAAFGLFSLFQGIRLAIGILVGSPFIFEIVSVLFLFAAIVFADMARMLGVLFVAPHTAGRDSEFRVTVLTILGMFLVAMFEFSKNTGYATGSPYFEMLIYLLTLLAVGGRVIQLRRCADQYTVGEGKDAVPAQDGTGSAIPWLSCPGNVVGRYASVSNERRLIAAAAAIGLLTVGLMGHPQSGIKERPVPNGRLEGDYNAVAEQKRMISMTSADYRLPPSLILYIRNDIPPLQTWFGGHTLPVMMVSNQYAPVMTVDATMTNGFEANQLFIKKLFGTEMAKTHKQQGMGEQRIYGLTNYLVGDEADTQRFFASMDELKVQWIITRPYEKVHIEKIIASSKVVQNRLEQRFEVEGFKIFKLKPGN